MYIIKMMSKDKIEITQEEYQKIISTQAKGLIFLERLKGSINLNSVESILPEDLVESDIGYLHDGTKVIKKFGEWRDASNTEIKLDASYYPEIANDDVKTKIEDIKKLTA